jgi:hypothetical protein
MNKEQLELKKKEAWTKAKEYLSGMDIYEFSLSQDSFGQGFDAGVEAMQIGINQLELKLEDIECVHMKLDAWGVPRSDCGENIYSVIGRMVLMKELSKPSEQPVIGGALEEKWYYEFDEFDINTDIRNMDDYDIRRAYYLQACRARQSEIDSWKHDHQMECSYSNELRKEIESLKAELHQQRFNNKHNLSIDQKVSDEIESLKAEIAKRDEFIIDLYKAFSGSLEKAILKESEG